MKAATSQSEIEKDHALIDSLTGAIAGVDGQIQKRLPSPTLQEQKNQPLIGCTEWV